MADPITHPDDLQYNTAVLKAGRRLANAMHRAADLKTALRNAELEVRTALEHYETVAGYVPDDATTQE